MYMYKIILTIILAMLANFSFAEEVKTHHDGQCYEIVDPYEKFNRTMFAINLTLDKTILVPVSTLYDKSVPSWGKDRINSFFGNLKAPLTFLNNVVQKEGMDAHRTFWRFLINSTFGIGGLFDIAGGFGLVERQQSFGDTFAHYGVHYGAYLMLPIIGPSTVRDGAGKAYDLILDPLNLVISNNRQKLYYYSASTINKRADLLDLSNSLEESSIDYYAAVRSMYIQYLAKRNKNCKPQVINYNLE